MSNVPKLRFKEFSGEWKQYKLGDIVTFSKGKAISKSDISKNGINECIRYGELFTEYNEVITNIKSKTNLYENLVYSEINDILMPTSDVTPNGLATASSINKSGVILGGDILIIKSDKIYNVFYCYFVSANKNAVIKLATGTTVFHIYAKDLKALSIAIPNKTEQEKIASFLTSVDTKIEQLTKKESLLQDYKKGVMQKIFNQEIRFKKDDGSEFCEWENKKLEDFLNLTIREVPKPNENYLAIGIRSHCKGTFQKPDSEPDKIAMDKLYQVKENDLIVNITFAWESAIAIVKKEDENGLVSHRFPTYTFNKDLAIVEFFRYIIIQKKFRRLLDLISPGGAGRNRVMSKKDFLKLSWKLPCIEEQEKIANFLSSIDKKIEVTKIELEKTKEFKKALLQQMFI